MTDAFADMVARKGASPYNGDLTPPRFREGVEATGEPLEEGQLLTDQKFIESSKVMYSLMQDEPFSGTDDEAGRYGINLIADFNYNFGQPFAGDVAGIEVRPGALSQVARLIAGGSKENAMKWIYMMDQYERLPNWTASGSWRAARGLLMDPTTWGAAFTGGVGFFARKAGQEVVSLSIRKLAQSLTTKKAAAVGGAVYAGAPEGARLSVQDQAGFDVTPEDIGTAALTTAVGAAAGPALIKAAELVPGVVRAVSEGLSGTDLPEAQ